eukprot:TRINITY_DN81281_c0_g1_i1.p1 TRINITY_DN81281_c0_g1~~TRINITY_DN81281_c0_g1_i1.p1  ORF type:complete len:243 (+),score=48.18 TRINITY_DN81281_c0_g1_i1:36-731(+)
MARSPFLQQRLEKQRLLFALLVTGAVYWLTAVAFTSGSMTGRVIRVQEQMESLERRRWLTLGAAAAAVQAQEGVHAIGIAMDYRKFEDIDPSKRKVVGDVSSETVKRAAALIEDCGSNMAAMLKEYSKDEQGKVMDFGPYLQTSVQAIRDAMEVINAQMDGDTRRDTERLGRLLLTERYKITGANAYQAPAEDRPDVVVTLVRANERVQKEFAEAMFKYVQITAKILEYVQ